MTHGEIARVAFETLRVAHARNIRDPLRQAHAIAAAVKLAEADHQQHLHRPNGPQRQPIPHGTAAGYYAHHRRHELPVCDACATARNEADRNRKRTA